MKSIWSTDTEFPERPNWIATTQVEAVEMGAGMDGDSDRLFF
jgi:hypothetical protein